MKQSTLDCGLLLSRIFFFLVVAVIGEAPVLIVLSPFLPPCSGELRTQKFMSPLLRIRGYRKFTPVVRQTNLNASPAARN